MLLKEDIAQAFHAQQLAVQKQPSLLPREYLNTFIPTGNHVEVISGVRRCGKSSLMKLLMANYNKVAYLNFEDARLFGFDVQDFAKLDEAIGSGYDVYFFDEIQNVEAWEVFVRQLHDRQHKVFVTGSNASLLSKELGTRLTGRHIRHELFPFSFQEFASFTNQEPNADAFALYLETGGFPEFIKTPHVQVLQNLFQDIVLRDIAIRYSIRNTHTLMQLALYLLSNIGKEVSYNSLRKTFNIGSPSTVSDYLNWFEDSYILLYLPRFSWSPKKQITHNRKVYAIDTGLVMANSLSHSKDKGRLFENSILMHFRRQQREVYFYREKQECDFVVMENGKCTLAVQCCITLHRDNMDRELNGLLEAMQALGAKTGIIVTLSQSDTLQKNGVTIQVIPAHEFFTNK